MSWVVSWIDGLIFLLLIMLFIWLWFFSTTREWDQITKRLYDQPRYLVALMVLILYGSIGILDSIHFKTSVVDNRVYSVLDVLLSPYDVQSEVTYSAPFAVYSYSPEVVKESNGLLKQTYPKLQIAGKHFKGTDQNRIQDILSRFAIGVIWGLGLTGLLYGILFLFSKDTLAQYPFNKIQKPFFITLACILSSIMVAGMLIPEYHIFGTDKIGRDVFYLTLKSIRTGLVIGTVTTLVMLPFALVFGMWAGYFRGWIDDVIQYLYTTISSIPGILLIAAAMLSFVSYVEGDPDLRLLVLCIILGISSWTTLCRLLRGESLKLRSSDFIQSAIVLGVKPLTIVRRHIMPNLMHIVIIAVVLDFSSLVLAEAVLSYVGVGVDPASFSWGNLINAARLDMARDPMVWWSLGGALIFMFVLVFSANIFSDALQEALNPKAT